MKKYLWIFTPIFIFAMTGKEVIDKQEKMQSVNSDIIKSNMIIIDSSNNIEKRKTINIYKKLKNVKKSVITFLYPSNVKGVALLNYKFSDYENQWLYLPALHRFQQIAEGSKFDYFMGTDFTYEDLSPINKEHYTYKLLREETIENNFQNLKNKFDCYVVESKPKEKYKNDTLYSKKILWIEKNNYYTVRIDFYNKDGKLIKRELNFSFKNIPNKIKTTIYRPIYSIMNNFKEKHLTLVNNVDIKVNININYKLNQQNISNGIIIDKNQF